MPELGKLNPPWPFSLFVVLRLSLSLSLSLSLGLFLINCPCTIRLVAFSSLSDRSVASRYSYNYTSSSSCPAIVRFPALFEPPPLPRKGVLFVAGRDCRKANAGPDVVCGGPWAAPCFDRSRCHDAGDRGGRRGGHRGSRLGGGPLPSVYVHDETCSMRPSSEIAEDYRGVALPKAWQEVPKAMRHIAATR